MSEEDAVIIAWFACITLIPIALIGISQIVHDAVSYNGGSEPNEFTQL